MIALVDFDSYYVNCQYAFDPKGVGKPGGVLSNNDDVFISANRQAKNIGIKVGTPYFEVKDVIKFYDVNVYSPNFSLYIDMHRRAMPVIAGFGSDHFIYSVDEIFLDMSRMNHFCLHTLAGEIRENIYKLFKLPVSVSIGPTKTLAKVASFAAKRIDGWDGTCVIDDRSVADEVLGQMPIEQLWGIGKALPAKFHALGIKTAKQLRDYRNVKEIRRIAHKPGVQLFEELNEIQCHPLKEKYKKKKQIIQGRTFGKSVFDKKSLMQSLAKHVHGAAERMRAQGSVCTKICASIRTSSFREVPQYYGSGFNRLNEGTLNTLKLTSRLNLIVDDMFRNGFEYKRSSVLLSDLKDSTEYQASLFESGDNDKEKELMKVMDKINLRFGPMKLKSMTCGTNDDSYKMKRNHLSPRYTTSWNELPKCR